MGCANQTDGTGKEITIERVEELYEFLQGKLPDKISMPIRPKLTKRMSYKIIWFLQEHMDLLPDHFEQCCSCGELYDANCEGNHKDNRDYCEQCW